VELREGRLLYTDLGSSNGTFLNGKELTEHKDVELASGDKLILGDTELVVTLTTTAAAKATSPAR
jgi:pSer/pThr/pTyr-binding forkhead associated (FHA) protein